MRIPAFPRLILPALAACLLPISLATAQEAVTTPVGVMTIDFPATGATPATTSRYIGIPLHSDAVFSGRPSAVGTDTITFSGVNWATTPQQFGGNPPRFVVRIMSGQQAGRILHVLSNTAETLTVSTNDRTIQSTPLNTANFSVGTNDLVEIVPVDTLAGIFGDNTTENPLLLVGNQNAFFADTVSIFDRNNNLWVGYFFNTIAGQWRRSGANANANDTPLYPDDAILVVRRANRQASQLILTGRVPRVAPLVKAYPGRSYVTTLGLPVDVPLSQIALSGSWTRANNAFQADTISLFGSTSQSTAFFQRLDGSWRNSPSATAPDVSSTVIPAGAAITVLERTSNLTGANSFVSATLPYNLNAQ